MFRNLPSYAERPAIRFLDPEEVEEQQVLTYAELAHSCKRLAVGLLRAGIHPGDRVAFFLPNCPALIISYYGTWLAGAIAVPCNPMNKVAELGYQLLDSGSSLLITSGSLYPLTEEVARPLGIPVFVAPADTGAEEALPAGAQPLTDLGGDPEGFTPPHLQPERDLALLLYTGGTTGLPKGAMLSHRNIVTNTLQFATWYSFEEGGETCISTLPLFHSGGMAGAMNVPLYSAATLLLFPRFRPAGVMKAIERYKATRFFGVPAMYSAVLNLPDCRKYNLSSLRACRTSAAPLPAATKSQFDSLAGREILVEGYGLTETSPLAIANPIGRAKKGSIGIPLPDTDTRILDLTTGQAALPGQEGELVLRGPQVMLGYWQRPEETAAAFAGGWFHTGDIAQTDEDGYLYIVDRMKDMINTAGYKVWPREVEEVLYQHPAVQRAAVVGVQDSYRGETVKAFLVLKDSAAGIVTADEITNFCRERLAAYKVPRHVEFCRELPTSGAGKVLKRVLREGEQHQGSDGSNLRKS